MKSTVLILYGGKSVEHEISVRSARNVFNNIDKDLFETVLVGITKNGDWFITEGIQEEISKGENVSVSLSTSKFKIYSKSTEIEPDVIFPVLHGTDGEDGSIQGLFKSFGKTIVGSGVLGSSMSMDKITTKQILNQSGIPTSRFLYFDMNDKEEINFEKVTNELGLPLMVKSSNQGSSVGVSKASDESSFYKSIEDSFKYSNQILIEEFVEGKEVECAVKGNKTVKSTIPGEIDLSKDYEFYTYQAKYQDPEAIKMVIPARLTDEETSLVREYSEKAFVALRCEDFARVDLFVTKDNKVLVNEINTIPGFTSASMFPVMWQNMGIEYRDLITDLINLALDRKESTQRLKTHYDQA